MYISKNDYKVLCNIARIINDEEFDIDRFELWEELNDVIQHIDGVEDLARKLNKGEK